MAKQNSPKTSEAIASLTLGTLAGLQLLSGTLIGPIALMRSIPWAIALGTAASGIHSAARLKKDDYMMALPQAPRYFTEGAKELGIEAPVVGLLSCFKDVSQPDPTFDPSSVLTNSAMIVAPKGTGKSFLLSLLMQWREKLYPGAPFKIGTPDTFKRGQTWMGLASCPRWLQENYMCLGYKYEQKFLTEDGTPNLTKAIFAEIDDMVDSLYAEMCSRQTQIRDANGDESKVNLQLQTGIIDEFPQYWHWLDLRKDGDRQQKIKALLCQGHGFHIALWIVSQSDAVNMIGLQGSAKEQLMLVRPFKPGEYSDVKGTLPKQLEPLINSMTCRRVLFLSDNNTEIQPIPECETEPTLDWSKLIKQGEFMTWLDATIRPKLKLLKGKNISMTQAWTALTNHESFPEFGIKRQADDNEGYVFFRKMFTQEVR